MVRDCNRSRGTKRSRPPELSEAVLAAARLRESLFGPFGREEATSAYRLVHGAGDGIEGFFVDVYEGFLVVQVAEEEALARADALEAALDAEVHPRGIVRKLRYSKVGRGRVHDEFRGERPPESFVVREAGIPFEVELMGGFHTGLFTDMREEHVRMRQLASGRRVLNTFAYTGAFSVAAAVGGAAQVTSVDVVEKVLARARRNFLLSGLDPDQHHFARMEVLDYLGMAKRRGWSFDAIVLDPPTFASFKSGTWSLKTAYPELLSRALALLEPGGLLWAAANTESLSAERFWNIIRKALDDTGREFRSLAVTGLPADYPTPPSAGEEGYLKVHVVEAM